MDACIGRRLRSTRRKRGITQECLAEALQLSPQQIQKYEAGVSRLSASTLLRLSRVLHAPIDSFFPEEKSPISATEPQELDGTFAKLAPDSQKLVLALIEALMEKDRPGSVDERGEQLRDVET